MRKGIAVSPGVAIGTAYVIHDIFVNPDTKRLESTELTAELARFETARDRALTELRALEKKVNAQVGPDEASIFTVHQALVRDPAISSKIRRWICKNRITASAALRRLLREYETLFAKGDDEYLRERFNDLRDVVVRMSAHLTDVQDPEKNPLGKNIIVVADELLPSHAVALGDLSVSGIVTQAGSQTSHAAIVARSRGIPAVSGVVDILKRVKTGDIIVVDGREGLIDINPSSEKLSAFRKLEREFFDFRDRLAENRDHPAVTANGVELHLQANINGLTDAQAANAMGATGVGLYRTEYLYLTHPNVPDENEQYEVYKQIFAASPNQAVTIRTLDIGGDKTVAYLGHNHQEANPFLGWRSIRLSFEHPEFFKTQLRAILRAAAEFSQGSVRLLFPMITTVEEIAKLRRFVKSAVQQLEKQKKPYREVPLGMMLEVPAAAITIRMMLDQVDFVSIGSNDLVQYLMAADRDNPKVNKLCQPLAPAVLMILKHVIEACNEKCTPVTVCGEMAGQPKTFLLLLGMGLRRFSMSPALIPSIKQLASQVTIAETERILNSVLKLKRTDQISNLLRRELNRISPQMAHLLDTK
jgi:phosphoenolpyruvate-protein phosphotransferase (PTS system enzyme I)